MPDSANALHSSADAATKPGPDVRSAMREILDRYPGAQRALFRRYHIGGCSSCAFSPEETLEDLCRRNQNLDPSEVLRHIEASHQEESRIWIEPSELNAWIQAGKALRLVDVRTREEWNATRLNGAVLLAQPVMQEILGKWPRDQALVIYDHQGRQSLDAAAFFMGHGFQHVRCLRGGIDAWSQEVDASIPRYRLER